MFVILVSEELDLILQNFGEFEKIMLKLRAFARK